MSPGKLIKLPRRFQERVKMVPKLETILPQARNIVWEKKFYISNSPNSPLAWRIKGKRPPSWPYHTLLTLLERRADKDHTILALYIGRRMVWSGDIRIPLHVMAHVLAIEAAKEASIVGHADPRVGETLRLVDRFLMTHETWLAGRATWTEVLDRAHEVARQAPKRAISWARECGKRLAGVVDGLANVLPVKACSAASEYMLWGIKRWNSATISGLYFVILRKQFPELDRAFTALDLFLELNSEKSPGVAAEFLRQYFEAARRRSAS